MWVLGMDEAPMDCAGGAGRGTGNAGRLVVTGQKSGQWPFEKGEARTPEVAAMAVWFTRTGKDN